MFSPTKSSIKEANEHLQALYQRVSELETTVKEQAESLMKRDEDAQRSIDDLTRAKDREINELRKSLEASEGHVQSLLGSCREKDTLISHLQYKCKLLDDATRCIPTLDQLMKVLLEAQRFGGSTQNCTASSPPGGPPTNQIGIDGGLMDGVVHHNNNSRNFSISEDGDDEDDEVRFRQGSTTHSTV